MMKWKARTETTNIGILELGNLTFDEDYIEVSIDICDMSDNLKAEVEKAIEIAKVRYTEEREADNKERDYNLSTVWSDKPVVMDFTYLRVVLKAGEPITYTICIGFHDTDNRMMEQWDCAIEVDLSEYTNELKKAIIKVLVDKFF
ncbi:hypothetical protein NSB25_28295 [Acetatifactor muris]|uniref:Uncharacterized protein n=1 Tax=Acetatifactor muris TaxID=879566 RepID=A0A2K4ZQ92_9FIRM|nr:hypothetical protein [Acetatifactor muris]MCR2051120.1 hypothetical protein [Acetatifactor muris]SOY32664.1 hypothetical protein AMURIS_05430 [Acetatifactor muris]